MAEFKLVIHGLSTKEKPSEKTDMSLETGTTPKEIKGYLYSLVGLSMNKQMYQPNMPMQPNSNTQNSPAPQFPPQGWMQNQQNMQNAQNQQWQAPNPAQPFAGPNPQWQPNQQQPPNQQQNRGPYMPPAPQQNTQNN